MNPDVPGEYRDRKTGLVVFGILEIVLGAMAWLLVPLMILSATMAPRSTGSAAPMAALLPAVMMYLVVGVVFVGLGIGSIMGRRWARALWVCCSGVGLGVGLLALPFVVYVALVDLPRTMAAAGQAAMPSLAVGIAQVVTVAFALVVYVVIPAALFLFYRSPHVKRTCERLDPQERWTDGCPLPVLALSLLTGVGAFGAPIIVLGMRLPFPLFGGIVDGNGSLLLVVGYSAVMLYAAMGLYRLRMSAWWLLLGVMLVMGTSGCLMLWRADLAELYAKMGFEPGLAARSAEFAQRMKWAGIVAMVPWLVWIFAVRRYFVAAARDDGDGVA